MTFSIIGRCKQTEMVGIAITTSSICVGSRCPWVRAGVGAVSTQNVTLPSIGQNVLDGMEKGYSAKHALDDVMQRRQIHADYRQVTVIDNKGMTAHFSGKNTLGTNAVYFGDHCIAAGNLLVSESLPEFMVNTFESNQQSHLAERLLTALEAGLYQAGGEQGAVHSSCLLVADKYTWPVVDLRIDWDNNNPVKALRLLWHDYEKQMADYVNRAINPASAPSYGVPGDE